MGIFSGFFFLMCIVGIGLFLQLFCGVEGADTNKNRRGRRGHKDDSEDYEDAEWVSREVFKAVKDMDLREVKTINDPTIPIRDKNSNRGRRSK